MLQLMNRNIIFYSYKCKTCTNLLQIMKNENLLGYFTLYCVDNNIHNLPPNIKHVPTLIVQGIDKPLLGKETFDWVESVKFFKQQKLAEKKPPKNNILGWSNLEMGGKTDTYAYKDVDKALSHAYFGVGDEEKHAIFTAPKSQIMNKKQQNSMIKQLEQQRQHQDKQTLSHMKNDHMNAMNQ